MRHEQLVSPGELCDGRKVRLRTVICFSFKEGMGSGRMGDLVQPCFRLFSGSGQCYTQPVSHMLSCLNRVFILLSRQEKGSKGTMEADLCEVYVLHFQVSRHVNEILYPSGI